MAGGYGSNRKRGRARPSTSRFPTSSEEVDD
jgi:hypothetical protein